MEGFRDSLTCNDVVPVLSRLITAGGHFWGKTDAYAIEGQGLLTPEDEAFIAERKTDVIRAVTGRIELRAAVTVARSLWRSLMSAQTRNTPTCGKVGVAAAARSYLKAGCLKATW